MRDVYGIELQSGSKEERLPGFEPDFPYIASHVFADCYPERTAPWHWHRAVELFRVESGSITYYTPNGTYTFQNGDCGMVNSNVLHQTKSDPKQENVLMLHLFDPFFLAEQGSRIAKKYILPLISSPGTDMIALRSGEPDTEKLIGLIEASFSMEETVFGYEMKIRDQLSAIWLELFARVESELGEDQAAERTNVQIKNMLGYIHEHYAEKVTVAQIAQHAYLSERECYRIFQKCIHMSPVEYLTDYRLKEACRKLADNRESLTSVALSCGFSGSSYFGKLFKASMGCTPLAYRKNSQWQDRDKKGHK